MNQFFRSLHIVLQFFVFASIFAGRQANLLRYEKGDFLFDFKADQKTEVFYVKNGEYFSGSPLDQWVYAQSTWDFTTHTRIGNSLTSKLTLRNKAKWGNTRSIFATTERLKIVDFYISGHNHSFNRLLPWLRKAWLRVSVNDAFGVKSDGKHYLKFGVFPYEVGRGISLGSAYAITPGVLGFFSDNTIDQYAFGASLRGDIRSDGSLKYDVYTALLENSSGSFSQTTEVVNTNSVSSPSIYRGFGDINSLLVGKLFFKAFETKSWGCLTFEPYVVYDWVPAQKVEVNSDANVKLGTFGAAVEYVNDKYEFGFESAFNFGRQYVKAWDRNTVLAVRDADTGYLKEAYNSVYTDVNLTTRAAVTDANKDVVDNQSIKGPAFNGQRIGTSDLYNSLYRFRPGYANKFAGNMFVVDGTYYFKPDILSVSLAGGCASGDEHPNIVLDAPEDTERNSTYGGFIGLQEIYSGKRVRSVFVIGGQRIVRPLSSPELRIMRERQLYAVNVSGFSNLVYAGANVSWTPSKYEKKLKLSSNALYYWQDKATDRYCLALKGSDTSTDLDSSASKALGLEINLFLDVKWLENFKGFIATAFFVPGKHFEEVIGKPVNAAQLAEVTRSDRYGIDYNRYPLINNKVAYLLNAGFQYLF